MPSSHTDEQPPIPTEVKPLIPIGEAAKILGVSVNTMRRWDRLGKLVALRTLDGHRRYRRAELEALVGAS
jgi:excisionase family DNA binding protein